MAQTINTNIASLNAQRNLTTSQTSLATSLQRLSSGLRINSAKDDAAGLAISERFTTQIRGLNQATRNANDGISLAQTGEGALAELTGNLQRIRELAVQSANATNSASDRSALNLEVQQRLSEIERTASQTSFNGRKILDGSFGNTAFQIGANVGETIGVALDTSMRQSAIGAVASEASVDLSTLIAAGTTGLDLAAGELVIGSTNVTGLFTTVASLTAAINTAAGSSIATTNGTKIDLSNTTTSAITITGSAASTLGITTLAAQTNGASTVDNNITSADFTTYKITDLSVAVASGSGGTVTIAGGSYTATTLAAAINTAATTAKGAALTAPIATVSSGAVSITNGETANAITFSGTTDATALGLGTIAASASDTIAATAFNQFNVTALSVGSTAVVNGSYTAASLITAINTAAGSTIAATDGSGGINVTNATTSPIVFSGANATTLGIGTVAARASDTPGTDSTIADLTATLATVNAATNVTVADNFTITIDGADFEVANGPYSTQQSLVDAVNTALAGNGNVSLDTATNVMTISAGSDIAFSGAVATTLGLSNATASGSLATVNVLDVNAANDTMQRIDAALSSVSTLRSTFGAIQNRFESVISSLTATAENLTSARSRIQDADFAMETAALTRNQILQQAGIAMLAQANALPNQVLTLLRG